MRRRWRQNPQTGELIEVRDGGTSEASERQSPDILCGSFDPYRSPVDGTIIHSRKQLEEHNRRNNVVLQAEYGDGFFERKRQERVDYLQGRRSRKEQLESKRQLYEIMTRAER